MVFDLDGVITDTAVVHKQAWKKLFDQFLQARAKSKDANPNEERYDEFTDQDYLKYVDGMPRYEGAKTFLQSRGIEIPFGVSRNREGGEWDDF